jgi:hypothetical protein
MKQTPYAAHMFKVPEGYRLIAEGEPLPEGYLFHLAHTIYTPDGGSTNLNEWSHGFPEGVGKIQGSAGFVALRIVKA